MYGKPKGWRVLLFSQSATLFFSKIWSPKRWTGKGGHTKNKNLEGIKHSCVDVTGERIGGPTIMRVNKMRAKKGKDHRDKFRQKNGLRLVDVLGEKIGGPQS